MGRREGHGTFSREMMLPELLRLFITPGNCGLCYFLIRLVLRVPEPALGMSVGGGQPRVPEDTCHPGVPGTGTEWDMADHVKEKGR